MQGIDIPKESGVQVPSHADKEFKASSVLGSLIFLLDEFVEYFC